MEQMVFGHSYGSGDDESNETMLRCDRDLEEGKNDEMDGVGEQIRAWIGGGGAGCCHVNKG